MTPEQFAKKVLDRAVKLGAKQAEVFLETSRESSVRVREGEIEDLTQATAKGLGLRVIVGGRLGFAYTSDFDPKGVDTFAERALALAKAAAADKRNVLPDAKALAHRNRKQALFDPAVEGLSSEWKIQASLEMEQVARATDKRITHFDSCGAGESISEVFIASSEGLQDRYRGSYVYLFAQPVAADGKQLQVGSWSDSKRFLADLDTPEQVGRIAAERAVRMLGARKVKTQRVPVIFDPQMAASFVGSLASAVNGDMIFKRASFLLGKRGEKVAPDFVTVVDDGLLERGLATSPFDGEGVATRVTEVIGRGTLQSYLYDTYTARKEGTQSTGNASRGYSSLPSIGVSNFYLRAGASKPEEMIRKVKRGLYVTQMLGRGANAITGDYSRGANGMWISNGELAYPVQECTVAGNMLEMLGSIDAIGDDLVHRGSMSAPTLRFAELTVSGS